MYLNHQLCQNTLYVLCSSKKKMTKSVSEPSDPYSGSLSWFLQHWVTGSIATPFSSKFAGTHLYTWVERGTVRVMCFAQEHNAAPWPGLKPGPFNSESSMLTIRPPRLTK